MLKKFIYNFFYLIEKYLTHVKIRVKYVVTINPNC